MVQDREREVLAIRLSTNLASCTEHFAETSTLGFHTQGSNIVGRAVLVRSNAIFFSRVSANSNTRLGTKRLYERTHKYLHGKHVSTSKCRALAHGKRYFIGIQLLTRRPAWPGSNRQETCAPHFPVPHFSDLVIIMSSSFVGMFKGRGNEEVIGNQKSDVSVKCEHNTYV